MKSICTRFTFFVILSLCFTNLLSSQNCNEYPYIECHESIHKNRNVQFFITTLYDCNNQLSGGNILGYDGYRIKTENKSEITINIANSNFSFFLSVGTNCNNYNNIYCENVNFSNYSKTIDVSNYNEVFIGI